MCRGGDPAAGYGPAGGGVRGGGGQEPGQLTHRPVSHHPAPPTEEAQEEKTCLSHAG